MRKTTGELDDRDLVELRGPVDGFDWSLGAHLEVCFRLGSHYSQEVFYERFGCFSSGHFCDFGTGLLSYLGFISESSAAGDLKLI